MKYIPPLTGDMGDPDRPYIDANPAHGIEGSIPSAKAIEHPIREIVSAIEYAGLTPDGADLTQLYKAIVAIVEAQKVSIEPATTEKRGIARVATQAEVNTGVTDGNAPAFVTPETLPLPEIYKVARLYALDEEEPPVGFLVASGALIANADTAYPLLWAALQDSSNSWRCVTEAQWQALSNVTRDVGGVQVSTLHGIGGVTKFVIDLEAKTIRLPDTRGMVREAAGFDGLEVGGVHGEGIPDIWAKWIGCGGRSGDDGGGAVISTGSYYGAQNGSGNRFHFFEFHSNLVAPTSPQTQSRARGDLDCVYVGE